MTKSTEKKPASPKRPKAAAPEPAPVDKYDEIIPGTGRTRDEILATTRVSTLLALAMLHEAMTARDRDRIEGGNGIALVVGVPGADWAEPVRRALDRVGEWGETIARTGASRLQDKPEVGNDAVSDALSAGRNAFGVSQSPERYLPSALVAAADIRIDLGYPSARILRGVIRLVTGGRVGAMPPDVARGLGLDAVAACIRKGSAAGDCVRRLVAASRSAQALDPTLPDVPMLQDTHGYGDAKVWGLRLAAAVQEFKAGSRPWSSIEDRNVVLAGDAGTGKTTFARSLAKSCGLPLFTTSVSAWFATTGGYLNDVIKAVDAIFGQAAAAGPAVLLLDEIDAVPNRATVDNRNRDYWVPIVAHILMTLDSTVSGASAKLVVIGATNFPGMLDEALVRPGRLNRILLIERPDQGAVVGILRQHLGSDLKNDDLMPLAAIGQGATGAEVAGWARGARMEAKAAGRAMVLSDLLGQIARADTRSPEALLASARHEAAHAVATEALHVGTVLHVSLVSRGAYAARTRARLRDATSMTGDELDAWVVSILAGRAADERWGRATSGAAGGPGSDLATATALVAGKHASWGLGGSLLYRGDEADAMMLLRVDPAFRKVVEDDLDRLYAIAKDFVHRNADLVDQLARRLVQRRVMSGDEVRAIIGAPPSGAGDDGPVADVGGRHG